MAERAFTTLLDGLAFPESPRWHAGRLWFCDVHDGKVWATSQHAQAQVVCEVPGRPTGIGWRPDGTLLVVSGEDRTLWRLDGQRLVAVADLRRLFAHDVSDMVVDGHGRAYIGSTGFDRQASGEPQATTLVCVSPEGEAWVVVDGLLFPNGGAVTADGATLVLAESFGQRLSAYAIQADGSLTDARVWADLKPNVPDGICLDAEGALWVADPVSRGLLRVHEGGQVTEWVPAPEGRSPYACVLGGADLRTLFVCSAETSDPARTMAQRAGRIETIVVDVPGFLAQHDSAPAAGEAITR